MITLLDTPIAGAVPTPPARSGGIDPSVRAAISLPAGSTVAKKLADPNVVVVTTGQQPGLFTGPLYTVHKALSARALAALLERRWQRPVVPVFWSAGDDHDYTEAATATWFGVDGTLVTGTLPPRPPDAPQRSLAAEPLPAEAVELLDRLGADLPESTARDQTLGWLRRHYHPGATIAGAFAGALAEILGPLGIAWFDPSHPAARAAARPTLQVALDRSAELDQRLAARLRELTEQGMAPDIKVGDGASLVFLDSAVGRDRLVAAPHGFRSRRGGTVLTGSELHDLLDREPGRFTPNVLLRPVVESALLPTVAYVAGPGELRYLRLAEVLYQPLGVPRQCPVPRWSGLVIEPRVTRALEKFQTSVSDVLADGRAVEHRILKTVVPPDFDPAFGELRSALERGFDRLSRVADAIDPTFVKPTTNVRAGALSQLADLEKRLLAAQKRRQSELLGQFDRARSAIAPAGKPQERVIGLPALLGRYGTGLLTDLAGHIERWYQHALEGREGTP